MSNKVEAGRRYGKLVLVARQRNGEWKCLCDCGNHDVRSLNTLASSVRLNKTPMCWRCRGFKRNPSKTPELNDIVERMWDSGAVIDEIASRTGMTPKMIDNLLNRRGVYGSDVRHKAVMSRLRSLSMDAILSAVADEPSFAASLLRKSLGFRRGPGRTRGA